MLSACTRHARCPEGDVLRVLSFALCETVVLRSPRPARPDLKAVLVLCGWCRDEAWRSRSELSVLDQVFADLYGKHAAALYAQAADFNKTARFYYMKAQDAYYLANAQASYDDWRRARRQWVSPLAVSRSSFSVGPYLTRLFVAPRTTSTAGSRQFDGHVCCRRTGHIKLVKPRASWRMTLRRGQCSIIDFLFRRSRHGMQVQAV